jgi:hypothetical protein
MTALRWHTPWRLRQDRLAAGLGLAAYLVAAFGFPLPALSHKDSSQPFPCQHRACGCQSAEQCWRSCCCFTPEEHWDWARANHVEPPAYATKPANRGWHTVRLRDQAEGRIEPAASCPHCARATKTCCHDDHPNRPAPAGSWLWASTFDVLRCQGISNLWVTAGNVLPPDPPQVWRAWEAPVSWICCLETLPRVCSCTPPDPPPRSSCA